MGGCDGMEEFHLRYGDDNFCAGCSWRQLVVVEKGATLQPMSAPRKKPLVTAEEYLRLERAAVDKSEYFAGEIFTMAGARPEHSSITTNILGELRRLLKGSGCAPYDSNLRIWIPATGFTPTRMPR